MLTKEEIRFLDLDPNAPLIESGPVLEVFADGIADLKIHGSNFTATYFRWLRTPEGLMVREPNLRMTRELNSVFGMRERLFRLLQQNRLAAN